MGSLLQIAARGADSAALARTMEAALAAVERVDRLMSFHSDESELTRLNRDASRGAIAVDPWTYAVLRRAVQIAGLSDGVFDVTIGALLVERGLLPQPKGCASGAGNWRDITLLPGCRVLFQRPVLVDLGGIAKGFAVDQAIHALRRGGCSDAIVNAGGDLRAFGTQPRPIHLRRRAGLVPVAELRSGAIATSTPYIERSEQIGCIVDPRIRHAWHGNGSVMVAARSCAVADALTKVAALAGPACKPLLARFGAQAYWDVDP